MWYRFRQLKKEEARKSQASTKKTVDSTPDGGNDDSGSEEEIDEIIDLSNAKVLLENPLVMIILMFFKIVFVAGCISICTCQNFLMHFGASPFCIFFSYNNVCLSFSCTCAELMSYYIAGLFRRDL